MICDYCGESIRCVSDDPVCWVSSGRYHVRCLQPSESSIKEANPPKVDGRIAGAKSRWANMTPEQKAEQIKKMQAGRKKDVEIDSNGGMADTSATRLGDVTAPSR